MVALKIFDVLIQVAHVYTVSYVDWQEQQGCALWKILGISLGTQPCRLATGAQKSSLVAWTKRK